MSSWAKIERQTWPLFDHLANPKGEMRSEVVTSLNPTPLAGKIAVILNGTAGIRAANPGIPRLDRSDRRDSE
jgi:hypothetical protein